MDHSKLKDALNRVGKAAHLWSMNTQLTQGQQAMARALERQSEKLAAMPRVHEAQLQEVKLLCCYLYARCNGVKPDPADCPLQLCIIDVPA